MANNTSVSWCCWPCKNRRLNCLIDSNECKDTRIIERVPYVISFQKRQKLYEEKFYARFTQRFMHVLCTFLSGLSVHGICVTFFERE